MLHSPAATSDSSGFSERAVIDPTLMIDHPGQLMRPHLPGWNTTWSATPTTTTRMSSLPGNFRGVNTMSHARAAPTGSPNLFGYHNPTLMASPYSTLPRRPNATVTGRHSPALSARMAQMSPVSSSRGPNAEPPTLLELAEPGWGSVGGIGGVGSAMVKVTARTPLLEDDRESCV